MFLCNNGVHIIQINNLYILFEKTNKFLGYTQCVYVFVHHYCWLFQRSCFLEIINSYHVRICRGIARNRKNSFATRLVERVEAIIKYCGHQICSSIPSKNIQLNIQNHSSSNDSAVNLFFQWDFTRSNWKSTLQISWSGISIKTNEMRQHFYSKRQWRYPK